MSAGGSMTGAAELPSAPPAVARGDHPIARFVLRRIAAALGTLLIISMLVFVGTEVLPGDAASAVLGKTATPEQVAELRADMGLDRSIPVRYVDWLRASCAATWATRRRATRRAARSRSGARCSRA